MKKRLFTKWVRGSMGVACILAAATVTSQIASSAAARSRTLHIKGIAVTGVNDNCGQPIWFLPAPIPRTLHAGFVGQFDPSPGAVNSLSLSPQRCGDDILLASHTDAAFLAAIGFKDSDPRIRNIPLRQVPIIVAPDGLRSTVPSLGVLPPNPFPPTKSNPNDPITLGMWRAARGDLTIACRADGKVSVEGRFDNLISNGIYSVWGIWKTTPPGAPPGIVPVVPVPLGGVPNVFVADKEGKGNFERELAICPMDLTPDGSQLLFVSAAYSTDNNVSGAVPELPLASVQFLAPDGSVFSSNLPAGTATIDHVDFAVTVKAIPR